MALLFWNSLLMNPKTKSAQVYYTEEKQDDYIHTFGCCWYLNLLVLWNHKSDSVLQ